ncbi:transporter [Cesiribacter andamanensis]|uniref:Protein involved in meta-pathway of phenol degradation n=1 Tax=Cesiribacter andamanensis AMV16 TaxID=1279009 RepID=M7N853_9BACT|nr:transporter [Cesiribacter andamanensis]EMR03442.1 Protein involved in meta-pathway of phenol degradation [Cesiribacter andamanensis AMV16]
MKNPYFLSLMASLLLLPLMGAAQGCVAIRHFSSCGGGSHSATLLKGQWQASTNYRYFKSFRHFRGREEEPDRVANNTEVVNYSHALDLTLNYGINDRLFASVTLPFVYNDRSSLYEHGRSERRLTSSRGLADARIGAGYWLLSPQKSPTANLAFGLGLKLPTGNYRATDLFYNVGPDGGPEERPVDQSIQPGDGGVGLALELQGFRAMGTRFALFGSGFYLLNPREVNGTRTYRETLSPLLVNESIMSVPDQFALRAGASYTLGSSGLGLLGALRYEGVPVQDLIGGSSGFRRPGSVVSAEPGLSYMKKSTSITLSVPVALLRNRPQSITDLEIEQATGQPRNGDAAFADYLINLSVSYRFGKKQPAAAPADPFFVPGN